MTDLLARAAVLLKAAPTWLMAAAVAIASCHQQIVELLPESAQGPVATAVLLVVGTWIPFAVLIVRRVTPVVESLRGLLSPIPPRD